MNLLRLLALAFLPLEWLPTVETAYERDATLDRLSAGSNGEREVFEGIATMASKSCTMDSNFVDESAAFPSTIGIYLLLEELAMSLTRCRAERMPRDQSRFTEERS